jgi:formate hydrogenlyase subunit 6/NADH:ubiquinone oxidoreductase subunit I
MLRIEYQHLQALFSSLLKDGYVVVGPRIREGAIVYDNLTSVQDLPAGWTDEQQPGRYALKLRDDAAVFGYAVGPHSWKKFLFPPALKLFASSRKNGSLVIEEDGSATAANAQTRYAFFGIRSCELHALAIQDKVFAGGSFKEPHYQSLREKVFLIAVNCGHAGGSCFCASMETGPKATSGYDLALTEVIDGKSHYFIVEIGSEKGAGMMNEVPHSTAGSVEERRQDEIVKGTVKQMKRSMDTSGIKELLHGNLEHPRWDTVAQRCLTCANCTLVCPTCFCTTVEDVTDLTGEHAERWRKWDSCFTADFSYIHGGSIRRSGRSRYRQWLTHKLASWYDQFGTSGCVGCGRCITWCPAGIDITEEVRAIREPSIKK